MWSLNRHKCGISNWLFVLISHSFYLHCLPISSKIRYAYNFDLITASDAYTYISQLNAKMGPDITLLCSWITVTVIRWSMLSISEFSVIRWHSSPGTSQSPRNLSSTVSLAAVIRWTTNELRCVLGKLSLSSTARLQVSANYNHPQAAKSFLRRWQSLTYAQSRPTCMQSRRTLSWLPRHAVCPYSYRPDISPSHGMSHPF